MSRLSRGFHVGISTIHLVESVEFTPAFGHPLPRLPLTVDSQKNHRTSDKTEGQPQAKVPEHQHDPLQDYRMASTGAAAVRPTAREFLVMPDIWSKKSGEGLDLSLLSRPESRAQTPGAPVMIETGRAQAKAGDSKSVTGDVKATAAAPAVPAGDASAPGADHQHTVTKNDSLWKIAKEVLSQNGHGEPGWKEVAHAVQGIIEANRKEHPGLVRHPDRLQPGMDLTIPGDKAALPVKQAEATAPEAAKVEAAPRAEASPTQEANSKPETASKPEASTKPEGAPEDLMHHHRHHKPEQEEHEPHHGRHRRGRGQGRSGSRKRSRHKRLHGHESRRRHHHDQDEDPEEETPKNSKAPDSSAGKPDPEGGPKSDAKAGDKQSPDKATEGAPEDNKIIGLLKDMGHAIGDLARNVARELGTVGNCAKGPRLTYEKMGLILPQMVATEQGKYLEQTGLFRQVPRDEVKAGDYAYRHWNPRVIRQHHGVDKGDSFIVEKVEKDGTIKGANDHRFTMREDGGRYRDTTFWTPTPKFYELYGKNL